MLYYFDLLGSARSAGKWQWIVENYSADFSLPRRLHRRSVPGHRRRRMTRERFVLCRLGRSQD
jgi:hypothetical protein